MVNQYAVFGRVLLSPHLVLIRRSPSVFNPEHAGERQEGAFDTDLADYHPDTVRLQNQSGAARVTQSSPQP